MKRLPARAGMKAWLTALLVFLLWTMAAADDKSPIRVKGSNDMAGYVDALAKKYVKDHPNVTVVVSGGGTAAGIDGLFDNTVEVAMASLPLTEAWKNQAKERGLQIQERFFGWQGIGVFVNPDNEVSSLSLEQMRNIFTGKSTSWMDAMGTDNPPTVYLGEHQSADAYRYFQDYVLKQEPFKKDAVVRRYYRSIIKAVASDPYGIGLAPLAKIERESREHRVKMIAVRKTKNSPAVFPDNNTVDDRSYPLIRPLYLYTNAKSDKKFVSDFVEYCAVYGLVGKWKLPPK